MSATDDPASGGLDLAIRAIGPATEGGRLALSELARLAGGLQASLERIALSISGGATRPGRRPREIVDAVRLDFVGFQGGSAVLAVARAGRPGFDDDLLNTSLDVLESGINGILRDPSTLPPHFTPQVLNGIRELAGGISATGVTRIEFWRAGQKRFTIDEGLQAAVRSVPSEPVQQTVAVVGRLHMGDFSPAGLRCRIDTYAGRVLSDFAQDLRDAVLDAMDQMVLAEGTGEFEPNGTSVHLLHLTRLETVGSARPQSLDGLAREQRIGPLSSLDELGGAPIEDFDGFLEAVRFARSGDE